ncbi:MAG: hypothetical protein EZS28_035368, partial [Streblomastix strix]
NPETRQRRNYLNCRLEKVLEGVEHRSQTRCGKIIVSCIRFRRARQRERLKNCLLEQSKKEIQTGRQIKFRRKQPEFQPRYNTRDDFRSQGRGQRGGRGDYRGRCYRGNRGGHNRDNRATDTYYNSNNNLFSVIPWPPVELVPATTSNTVIPDISQRQIGGPTPQLARTPDSWRSNKTPTPKQQSKQPTPTQTPIITSQSSETISSNIIPIPTPSMQQIQQEQDHLLHPPVAVSPPPIIPSNVELPPVVEIQPNIIIQSVNNILPDPPNSWANIATQPTSLDSRAQQGAQRLHDYRILQENRAKNEYRIHMQERAQNKAQKFLMDGMLMNLEARSKGFDNPSFHSFGNIQPNYNPNQYIENLSQIPQQDYQDYSNDFDQYQMQRDDDHDSNDDVFGEADLIQLQVRGQRGRGKKNRGRGKAQSQVQPLLSSHQPIQGSMQSKLKVLGQWRRKTGAAT